MLLEQGKPKELRINVLTDLNIKHLAAATRNQLDFDFKRSSKGSDLIKEMLPTIITQLAIENA